jgi:hypothetical protein
LNACCAMDLGCTIHIAASRAASTTLQAATLTASSPSHSGSVPLAERSGITGLSRARRYQRPGPPHRSSLLDHSPNSPPPDLGVEAGSERELSSKTNALPAPPSATYVINSCHPVRGGPSSSSAVA